MPTAYQRRPFWLWGIVFGSVIMKKRKTRISGEKTRIRQSSQPSIGPRCQRAVIAWPVAASTASPAAKATQNPTAICEEVQAREDREAADDDDRQRERHPGRHRPPPEVERLGARGAEHEEAEDEPEVGRVEDVAAAELDHVLGEQRDRRRAHEDPPAVQAPPVAVLGAGDAEDEGDSVPGQQRARRPHEHVLAKEGDADLEHSAGEQRDEDLGDRQAEVERHLAEHLERDDHGRQVQARIPPRRQEHRVLRASNPDRRLAGRGGGRVHRRIILRSGRRHSRSSWIMRGDAWMQTISSRSSPVFLNLCGVSGPTTRMSPGPASNSSPSAVKRALPLRTIHVSE